MVIITIIDAFQFFNCNHICIYFILFLIVFIKCSYKFIYRLINLRTSLVVGAHDNDKAFLLSSVRNFSLQLASKESGSSTIALNN